MRDRTRRDDNKRTGTDRLLIRSPLENISTKINRGTENNEKCTSPTNSARRRLASNNGRTGNALEEKREDQDQEQERGACACIQRQKRK